MNRSNAQSNLDTLTHVANHLGKLCNEMTFVGGSITGFLITDKAAPDVRFTKDIDCIVDIVSTTEYHKLSEKLRERGLKELPHGKHPICRWDCHGTLLDIMPIDERVFGFTNKWYKDALLHPLLIKINETITIKIISAPYFIGTKIEAFKNRGNNDFLSSHDLEDIISLIDGRPEILDDIANEQNNLKKYLIDELKSFLNNSRFQEALPGHLNYSDEADERKNIVLLRIQQIIALQ